MPKIGKGQTLGMGDVGETPMYTDIGKIRDVSGPSTTVDSIESTHAGSSSVEKIPGFTDAGDFTAGLVYEPAQVTALRAALGTTKAWKWTLSDGGTYTFDGFITSLGKASPYKDLMTQDLTIAVTGEVTFTAPT